jgi:protein-disulfide isomerase
MAEDRRRRRLWTFGGALLVVIAAVGVAMAVASGMSSTAKAGLAFDGIPQSGNVLGSKNATATMMVFADMQCPFCKEFETQAFPSLVSRYVRTGKLRVVFQPISILGNDSVVASRAVVAAAQQNKMFDYLSTFYANQGEENSGYVTEAFLIKIAKAVPGLNLAKWRAGLKAQAGSNILRQAAAGAKTVGVQSTPTFLVARRGQTLRTFEADSLTPGAFDPKLNSLTG